MKKSIFTRITFAALAAAMLSSCSTSGNNSTKASPSETTSETAKSTQTSEQAPEVAESGDYFPLAEKITVTMAGLRADANTPFSEVAYFDELEERTNIHIEWLDWPGSSLNEKKGLAFASGDLPDAIYGSWVLSTNDVVNYGNQGFFLELNDYISEEYTPNFMQVMEKLPDLEKSITTSEGSIYAFPTAYRIGLAETNAANLINTDWLAAVGKEVPTTTDEFYDVLMAFKEAGDLNGNGKSDEIPFTFRYLENNASIIEFIGFTGMTGSHLGQRMVLKDDELVFFPAEDEFKEALTYLNKLYSNGLIDMEVFTMDGSAYNAKTQTAEPVAGVISGWSAETINKTLEGNDVSQDGVYVFMGPLQNSDNPDVEPVYYRRNNPLNSNLSFAISSKTKYAEELVRWADIAYDVDESIKIFYGPDGEFIKNIGDGMYENIKKEDGSSYSHADRSVLVPSNYGLCVIVPDNFTLVTPPNVQNKAAADAFYAPYLGELYDYSGMPTEDEATAISDISVSLTDYVDQCVAKFVTEGGIEEGWDAYIKGLKSLGMDEYVQIKKDIYDRIK